MKKLTLILASAFTALTLTGCTLQKHNYLSNQPDKPIIASINNSLIAIHVTDNLTAQIKDCSPNVPASFGNTKKSKYSVKSLYDLDQPLPRMVKNAITKSFEQDGYQISQRPTHTIHFSIISLNHDSQTKVFNYLNHVYLSLEVNVYNRHHKLVWEGTLHTKGEAINALQTGDGLRPALEMAIINAASELQKSKTLAKVLRGKSR